MSWNGQSIKNFFRNKVQFNICLPHLLLPWNDHFVLRCLKWSHHAGRFLNWTQHRLLIFQSDLVTGQNPDHLYRHEEQNYLGFLLKTTSNNLSYNVPYSREMSNINIGFSQFFRNFPSLDVFDHAVSMYHDFLTFILIFPTVIFCSYRSRGAFIFLFCLPSLSFYIITCSWVNVRFCVWFFLSVCLFAITRIALYSGFEFTGSPFTGGSSALTAIVLVER